MPLTDALHDLKNRMDFALRNSLPWSPSVSQQPEHTLELQTEISEFLNALRLTDIIDQKYSLHFHVEDLLVADIGARTFCFAPIYQKIFDHLALECEIHGIEIDGNRRFTNLRTRKAYGEYFAKQIPHGHFHVMDFLKWHKPLDVAFMLNPFVTADPLLSWGLPLKTLTPKAMYEHAYELLKVKKGLLVVSHPFEDEYKIGLKLAMDVGFKIVYRADWHGSINSIQKKSRLGIIFST